MFRWLLWATKQQRTALFNWTSLPMNHSQRCIWMCGLWALFCREGTSLHPSEPSFTLIFSWGLQFTTSSVNTYFGSCLQHPLQKINTNLFSPPEVYQERMNFESTGLIFPLTLASCLRLLEQFCDELFKDKSGNKHKNCMFNVECTCKFWWLYKSFHINT